MDEHLREVERAGSPPEILRARRRAGCSEQDAWDGLWGVDTPYQALISLLAVCDDLEFLGSTTQACGGKRGETARFAHRETGLVLRLIPGGRFLMGRDLEGALAGWTPDMAPHLEPEEYDFPQREVVLRPFLLSETLCTRAAWSGGAARAPVDYVSWNEAWDWCEEVGLRLPSESEWEYACRAGSEGLYNFGEDDPEAFVWHRGNAGGTPQPVGGKAPNAWGLYDMHGNLQEWCEDDYQRSYEGAPTDGSALELEGVSYRVTRGGSWRSEVVASGSRGNGGATARYGWVGFRPARSLDRS